MFPSWLPRDLKRFSHRATVFALLLLATVLHRNFLRASPAIAPKPPIARPDVRTTLEDTPITLKPLSNDIAGDRSPFITNASRPAFGRIHFTPRSITYVPHLNAHGRDSFDYTITDGAGHSSTAQIEITISPVDDKPRAGPPFPKLARVTSWPILRGLPGHGTLYASIRRNGLAVFDLTADAFDAEDDLLLVDVDSMSRRSGTITKTPRGQFMYRPRAGDKQSERILAEWDEFQYTLEDSAGHRLTRSVYIHVAHASLRTNAPTILVPRTLVIPENGLTTTSLLANSSDEERPLRLLSIKHQIPEVVKSFDRGGWITIHAPQQLPDSHKPISSLGIFRVEDRQGRITSALNEVIIEPINDFPTITDDVVFAAPGVTLEIYPLFNDTDPEHDRLFITDVDANGVGMVTFRPRKMTLSIKPSAMTGGVMRYTIADGYGGQRIGSIIVHFIFATGYIIERETADGKWITETGQIWSTDRLRWRPLLNLTPALPTESIEWKAVSSNKPPHGNPFQRTFAKARGAKPAVGNPGTGVSTISPIVTFGKTSIQSGFATRLIE